MCNEPGTGYDECNADKCCYTPYVVGSIAPGASATDTGFDFTYEEFSDVACTTRKTDFEGGMITGTSATCVPQSVEGGTTPFGFYAYCPGLTGTGAYEYVLASEGADRCPPAAGADGGASARFTCRQPAHAMRVFRAVLSPPRRRWLLCRWPDSRCQRVRCRLRRLQKADMHRSHRPAALGPHPQNCCIWCAGGARCQTCGACRCGRGSAGLMGFRLGHRIVTDQRLASCLTKGRFTCDGNNMITLPFKCACSIRIILRHQISISVSLTHSAHCFSAHGSPTNWFFR